MSRLGGLASGTGSLPYVRPNLVNLGRTIEGDFEDRRLNDGAVEIFLIDLDRQDKIAADYYRQREACIQEIKSFRADSSKVVHFCSPRLLNLKGSWLKEILSTIKKKNT